MWNNIQQIYTLLLLVSLQPSNLFLTCQLLLYLTLIPISWYGNGTFCYLWEHNSK